MVRHEYGPDFHVGPQGYDVSQDLAVGWARALRRWAPPNVDVVVAPPGKTVETSYPNLQFDVSEGWARGFAGFLDETMSVTIGQTASGQQVSTYSATAIEDLRAVHAEPGRNRVRIDLPWGTWTDFVDVPFHGEASCKPPSNVGLPPLRNLTPSEFPEGAMLINGQPRSVSVGGSPVTPQFEKDGFIGFRARVHPRPGARGGLRYRGCPRCSGTCAELGCSRRSPSRGGCSPPRSRSRGRRDDARARAVARHRGRGRGGKRRAETGEQKVILTGLCGRGASTWWRRR